MSCPECHKPMSENEMCDECGCFFEKQEFAAYDLYNYHRRTKRVYHRLDHFKEVLNQFQGREGKHIPTETLEQIKAQITNPNEATALDVKAAMRRLRLTRYMENAPFVLFAVSGKQPPYIPRMVEGRIVRMFKAIDRVFPRVQKDGRKSFLNYYFILFKLLELLREFEILLSVPILQTRLRLRQHDVLWKLLCEELGWSFKKTDRGYLHK